MIVSNNITSITKSYVEIVNDIFKSKQVATEFNLSEHNMKGFDHSWKLGGVMPILLDPINMKLYITYDVIRNFSVKYNKYLFLGNSIFLGNLCLQNSRRNKIFKELIGEKYPLDMTKEKVVEFLESTTFKRQVLKLVDELLKEKLLRTESEYISDLYNLRITFSEATVAQKIYAYYMEYQTTEKRKKYITMNSFEIPDNPELLLNAKKEIINYFISKKPHNSEYNPFTFLLWFDRTFYNVERDIIADVFRVSNTLFEKLNENSNLDRYKIINNLMSALNIIVQKNPTLFKRTNLSRKDKQKFLCFLKDDEIKYDLRSRFFRDDEALNLLKEDFIFNYKSCQSLAEIFKGDYIAFYIDDLLNVNTYDTTTDLLSLIRVSKKVTDLYFKKNEFENFKAILSILNLELTEYIPETTTIHFIEDDTSVLDRFIRPYV